MAGAVRQPVDIKALENYIDKNVPQIKTPIDLKQFGFGQSNPTYQITAKDGQKFVMRKKPPGKILSKTAHRVDREYKIIHALEGTDVPVPDTLCLCEDDSVVGTAFYIMSFLDGRFITEPEMPGVSAEDRREMWHDAIRTLAKYHKVDYNKVGLADFGKHAGFFDRQCKTFTTLSKDQAETKDADTKEPVGDIPYFHEMVNFFSNKSTQPKDRSTLIHGDYKIDNLVFHKTEPRVIGILDWEMATIGHPLSDFCNVIGPWSWSIGDQKLDIKSKTSRANPAFEPGATPGLPSLDEVIQWYKEESGYDVNTDLTWGVAFGAFRGAVIMQGIAARYAQRQASSASAMEYGSQMKPYGEWAYSRVAALIDSSQAKAKL